MAALTAAPSPAPTVADLQRRLDQAGQILEDALTRLQRARHAAVSGDSAALAEETAAEIACADSERQLRRFQAAVEEQQRLDGADASVERLQRLAAEETVFLEHLTAAEAAGAQMEKALGVYARGYAAYVQAAMRVQQLAPGLQPRIRSDFTLDRPEELIGAELARITVGSRHPPGTSLHHLQQDPSRTPPLTERITSLTGEWRANIEAARAARGG